MSNESNFEVGQICAITKPINICKGLDAPSGCLVEIKYINSENDLWCEFLGIFKGNTSIINREDLKAV